MSGRRIGDQMARNQRRDTAEDVAWRLRHHAVLAQVRAEREQRFPILTDANADDAIAFQESRIVELMAVAR